MGDAVKPDYVAYYGAILATIVFIWNCVLVYLRRGRLKVINRIDLLGTNFRPLYLFWKITNKGKEPVTVTEVGWSDDSGIHTLPNGGGSNGGGAIGKLPIKLYPTDSVEEAFPASTVLRSRHIKLWALDSLSNRYFAKSKNVNALIATLHPDFVRDDQV